MRLKGALVGTVLLVGSVGLPVLADSPEPNGVVPVPTLTVDKNAMTERVPIFRTAC